MGTKIAIVAVHGVIPKPRYGFQDQVAAALCAELNAAEPHPAPLANPAWTVDVTFPHASGGAGAGGVSAAWRPTISRVHRPDAAAGTSDEYEVIEAYWSPLDKGKATPLGVLTWLLECVFLPENTTARYVGWPAKARSDLGFALVFGLGACVALLACILEFANALATPQSVAAGASTTWWTPTTELVRQVEAWRPSLDPHAWWQAFAGWIASSFAGAWGAFGSLSSLAAFEKAFQATQLLRLALGAIGAYLIAQAARAFFSIRRQWNALAKIPVQLRSRLGFAWGLVLLGVALLWVCESWPLGNVAMGPVAVLLIVSALGFVALRSYFGSFLTQFFGDVQIYCTHDANSEFFSLRQKILDLVTDTIAGCAKDAQYERVFVFAHSLGSTIALDALIRLYNLTREGVLEDAAWQRIRGFVTFGTSLEKTRYFLNAYGTTQSASLEEWSDNFYGALFTRDVEVLQRPSGRGVGIYWQNYWYFFDFIADRVDSYRSFLVPSDDPARASSIRAEVKAAVKPGSVGDPIPLARNRVCFRPTLPWNILHAQYLNASWFWQTANTEHATPLPWMKFVGLGIPAGTPDDRALGALEILRRRAVRAIAPAESQPVSVSDRFESVDPKTAKASGRTDLITGE